MGFLLHIKTSLPTLKIVSSQNLSVLPAKKLILDGDQGVCDAAGFRQANVAYDQLHLMSMSKEFLNQDYMKTLNVVTNYVVVGSNPVYKFVTPHNFASSHNVNELASTVVSTVKSGK